MIRSVAALCRVGAWLLGAFVIIMLLGTGSRLVLAVISSASLDRYQRGEIVLELVVTAIAAAMMFGLRALSRRLAGRSSGAGPA